MSHNIGKPPSTLLVCVLQEYRTDAEISRGSNAHISMISSAQVNAAQMSVCVWRLAHSPISRYNKSITRDSRDESAEIAVAKPPLTSELFHPDLPKVQAPLPQAPGPTLLMFSPNETPTKALLGTRGYPELLLQIILDDSPNTKKAPEMSRMPPSAKGLPLKPSPLLPKGNSL